MNQTAWQGFRIEPLGREHERAAFSCGVDALDRYLKEQASQDAKRYAATPYVLVQDGFCAVLGYYTLSMNSVGLDKLPDDFTRKLPKYTRVPVVLIGRLAVDRQLRGKGLGRFLLLDAMARSLQNEIAWTFVIVQAKDESACAFYARYGFSRFLDERQRLFIHRGKIEHAFGGA